MSSYLISKEKNDCTGCEACLNTCPKQCIEMKTDDEGFRYPIINNANCIQCKLCEKVCPLTLTHFQTTTQRAFGGYSKDSNVLSKSTSGGAFTSICKTFCDDNFVIFGCENDGLSAIHSYIETLDDLYKFQQSKYTQSKIGNSYKQTLTFLKEGKKVIFSGTPCQIAGLNNFLGNKEYDNLLTIEVICEGVPTPLFIKSFTSFLEKKYNKKIDHIDYRHKDKKKWDFQVMRICFSDGSFKKIDRWFNPYWNIWLKHLMSRPSCYNCNFAKKQRVADITLGDLWGVHLYCQDLYNKNKGASLIITNTNKGNDVVSKLSDLMIIRQLDLTESIKYQSPMRKKIDSNPDRAKFMHDLTVLNYKDLIKKYYDKPTVKLLYSKYIYGNKQKVFLYNAFKKHFK